MVIFASMKFFTFFSLLFVCVLANAQNDTTNCDTILLQNGKKIGCSIIKTDNFVTEYKYTKRSGRVKQTYANNPGIFSLQYNNQEDRVLYNKDTLFGNQLSIKQMRKYVYGAADARKNYNTHWYFAGGAVLGFSSVFLDTYLYPKEAAQGNSESGPFRTSPSVFPIIAPIVYTVAIALPKTRLRKKHVDHLRLKNNEFYQGGFEKIARQKRIFTGLGSTAAGMALGYICYFIFRK